ncbi:hypothetical protein, partial [Nocardioides sp. NPDC000441]|uniref:hypothetical protein n=1 Tax=Nocardioides sp. NPDC000441 TaxID=3154256 RepID=UPI00332D9128
MAHLTGEVWAIVGRNSGIEGAASGSEDRPWARWFARSGSLQVEPAEAGEQARTLLSEDGQTAALRFNERVLDTLTGDLAGLVEYVTVLDGAQADEARTAGVHRVPSLSASLNAMRVPSGESDGHSTW